ncbi:MAG: PQQ-binding-like beta-propeller repeat protein [Myxococcota bacterium]
MVRRVLHRRGLLVGLLAAAACSGSEPTPEARPLGTEGGQWRSYAGDPASSKYAPLAAIDAGNFAELEIAWRWLSPDVAWKEDLTRRRKARTYPHEVSEAVTIEDFQVTPLMVDGVLYGVTSIGQAFALDAGSGETLWLYDPRSYASTHNVFEFIFPKHRGVTFWKSGDDERIFLPTIDAYLLALDARTGEPVAGFGKNGRVDLTEGLRTPDVWRVGEYFQSSPAALYGDTLIVGSAIGDRPRRRKGIPGDLRAYDARTGALRWTFHVIPKPGEPGIETWEDDSWRTAGSANVWGPMTVDAELGRVYAVTSTPNNDLYGGHRPGDNLFAESLLCLDAETGELLWHQQLIRHGLWDYDPAAPPVLVDIEVDGRPIRAVAQVTKQAFTFVFDRVSGEPVWPIEDRPVPKSTVPGERTAATQRFPTRPDPFDRQGMTEDDLIDLTPELRVDALAVFRQFDSGPLFSPPSLKGMLGLPGAAGGAGWRGAGLDPESNVLFVPSLNRPTVFRVEKGEKFRYETQATNPVWFPGGEAGARDGLLLSKPPWSRITAIDLDTGEHLWQVPAGSGPRNHRRLRGLDLPPLGSGAPTCVLVTKTLLLAGDGAELFDPNVGEPILRAFDKATGAVVGEVRVPSLVRGCPMTYEHQGRQYIVLAVAAYDRPELVALALPERRRTQRSD